MQLRVSTTFGVLIQFVLFTQYRLQSFVAASEIPVDAEDVNIKNEIPTESEENVRHLRETYALLVKSHMNASVDPCDDFYEYACGNYPNTIEDLQVKHKRTNTNDIYFTVLRLTNETVQRTRHPNEKYYDELLVAKQFFNSCVNARLFPMQPHNEYLEVLKSIGGFPAVDPSWDASTFDWVKTMGHLIRYGVHALVYERIFQKHPFLPYYLLPKFGFDFPINIKNIETKDSEGYIHNEMVMRDLLKAYGVTDTKADSAIEDVFDLLREVLLLDKQINEYGSCQKLQKVHESLRKPFAKWSSFLETAWGVPNFEISKCPCNWYYNQLDDIAKEKPEALANYLALKFLFSLHAYHVKSAKFQNRECVNQVKEAFPILISHFYMKDHFNEHIESDIFNILNEVKKSLRHIIVRIGWLDPSTIREAVKKLKTASVHVGDIKDPIRDTLIKEMNKLNITDSYASNNLVAKRFKVDMQHYFFVHEEVDKNTTTLELLDATSANCFYDLFTNSITVFAGLLNLPAYHPGLPESAKYAGLGQMFGHELFHAIDSLGMKIDSNLTIRLWWSADSQRVFNLRSKCFVEHYNRYSEQQNNKKINDLHGRTENIAIDAGLRAAFNAYRKVPGGTCRKVQDLDNDVENSLPGLDLDSDQVFFLSFAQTYCSTTGPKALDSENSESYPLNKYRVIGTLQNSRQFSSVFNCPMGSPMNPEKKCRIF